MFATFVERSSKIWNDNDGIEKNRQFILNVVLQKWYGYINSVAEQGKPVSRLPVKCFVLNVKAAVMSNFLFAFVKTRYTFKEECYAKKS